MVGVLADNSGRAEGSAADSSHRSIPHEYIGSVVELECVRLLTPKRVCPVDNLVLVDC